VLSDMCGDIMFGWRNHALFFLFGQGWWKTDSAFQIEIDRINNSIFITTSDLKNL
jgi:hypothetical protein